MSNGYTTKAIHTPFAKKDVHGALHMPVYDGASFELESAEDLADAFEGKKPLHTYSRVSNPTIEHFENKIRHVTGAKSVLAMSSGMAAISNLVMSLCGTGDHVISSSYLFGGTKSLFSRTLKRWGLDVSFVDLEDLENLKQVIRPETRLIFGETIANPQMRVLDIPNLAKFAKEHQVPLVIDSTITPPSSFHSKEWGVDVEIISSTKSISGGATTIGGLIIDNGTFNWAFNPYLNELVPQVGSFALLARLRKEVYRNLGACLSPHNAFMQSLGLETLALRMERSCQNAVAIGEFLENHPKVKKVNYPGLKSSPYYELSQKLFSGQPGSIFTFELHSKEECFRLINSLKLIRRTVNLNDNKTLIIHPASTIYHSFTEEQRMDMEVTPTLIRLSVGIEDFEDLKRDFVTAFESL